MVEWKAWEIKWVADEFYCIRRAYPGCKAEDLDAWITANAQALCIGQLERICDVQEGSVADFERRKPELEAAITNAPHAYAKHSAEERLHNHTRWAKKSAALSRKYRRLAAKIRTNGLPPLGTSVA